MTMRSLRGALAGLAALALLGGPLAAQRLPVKSFGTADGLPSSYVTAIVADPQGFLWFATRGGLARFDGSTFASWGTDDGLPVPAVNHLLVGRDGTYWIATNGGGVCRFDVSPARQGAEASRFETISVGESAVTNRVNALLETRAGRLWAATDGGLFELLRRGDQVTSRELKLPKGNAGVNALLEDAAGDVWATLPRSGLARVSRDGQVELFDAADGLPSSDVWSLLAAADGTVWVGGRDAVAHLAAGARRGALVDRVVPLGREATDVTALQRTGDGRLLVATSSGLAEVRPTGVDWAGDERGLPGARLRCLAEDRAGNLWIGTEEGAVRVARGGLVSFYGSAELPLEHVTSLFESGGELYASANRRTIQRLGEAPASLKMPVADAVGTLWLQHYALRDREGGWWAFTGSGLLRFAALARFSDLAAARPERVYTARDGLASNHVFRAYEDARGDLWLGISRPPNALARWERTSDRIASYGTGDGLPEGGVPYSFAEDRSGRLWIGFHDGGLARHEAGRFAYFGEESGVPPGLVTSLFVDSKGRLWMTANRGGAALVEDPSAALLSFRRFTTREGLGTNDARCLAEDRQGRIYVGGARGVDRLDLPSGQVRHYTTADGLASDFVVSALTDSQGRLWFGTLKGVSLLTPVADPAEPPPPVRIVGLLSAGVERRLSPVGESGVHDLISSWKDGPLRFDYLAIAFGAGERLRFAWKLDGAGGGWSPPSPQRSVTFANLPPGRYRFRVRAELASGAVSAVPAEAAFEIRPPLWRTPWFLGLGLAGAIGLAMLAYRARVQRLLELERTRARLAADLHDDVGSALSQIAVLAEVLRSDLPRGNTAQEEPLSRMARISREAVDAMGDMVWAINPARDRVGDLRHRVSRYAAETLPDAGIEVELPGPAGADGGALDADVKRETYLVAKEALHNVVKHAGARRVAVGLSVHGQELLLTVSDDGRGFDPAARADGLGLASMKRRAERVGGTLTIESAPGKGTALSLRVPLRRRLLSGRAARPSR